MYTLPIVLVNTVALYTPRYTYIYYTTHLCLTINPNIKGQYSRILRQTLLIHYISPHDVLLVYRADVDVRHRDRGLALLLLSIKKYWAKSSV